MTIDWSLTLAINFLLITLLSIIIIQNKDRFFSFYNFFIIWFVAVMLIGVPITYLLETYFISSSVNTELLFYTQLYSFLFIVIFILFYKLPFKYPRVILFPVIKYSEMQVLSFLFTGISFLAILYFLSQNGLLLLDSTSYEERYETNLGLGILTRFFPFFIAGTTISFILKPTYRNWIFNLLIGIFLGVLTYIVMGGYRQILAIHIFVFLILAYHYSYIKLFTIIKFGILAIPLLMFMALFRYGIDSSSDLSFNLLVFTRDSFAPYNSFTNIIEYYKNTSEDFQGLSIVLNEFSSLIPRSIWVDKPELVLNAGNFYTQEILKYNAGLTISPTILGSLFLISGDYGVILGSIFLAVMLRWFDKKVYRSVIVFSKNNREFNLSLYSIFYYYIIFYTFTIAREGIEVFLQRTIMAYIIFIVFVYMSKVIASAIKYKE
jgi:enterobacterial common antigen polymerase